MSILNYQYMNPMTNEPLERVDKRWERDALGDLKHGLDLIFALKQELEKLHPIAAETLIRLLSH
jgi:hypothetical protein